MSWLGKKITSGTKEIPINGRRFPVHIYWSIYEIGRKYVLISLDTSGDSKLTNEDKINIYFDELKRYAFSHAKNKKDALFRSSVSQYGHIYVLKEDYKYWFKKIIELLSDPDCWNYRSISSFPYYDDICRERSWIKDWLKRISSPVLNRVMMRQYKRVDSFDENQLLYFIACRKLRLIKIGVSVNPHKRLLGLQTAFPFPLEIIKAIKQTEHSESHLHNKFSKYRKTGEWFYYSDEIQTFINHL